MARLQLPGSKGNSSSFKQEARGIFTDTFLGMDNFEANREKYFFKSSPVEKSKLRAQYKRFGAEQIPMAHFNRFFDGMEKKEELHTVGTILREIAFKVCLFSP